VVLELLNEDRRERVLSDDFEQAEATRAARLRAPSQASSNAL
jgi:hypothetical protein